MCTVLRDHCGARTVNSPHLVWLQLGPHHSKQVISNLAIPEHNEQIGMYRCKMNLSHYQQGRQAPESESYCWAGFHICKFAFVFWYMYNEHSM